MEIDSELDGIDLISKVKETNLNIPIIMLTKHSDYRTVKKAMLAGALDYIVKPPEVNELINIINRAIHEVELKEKVEILKNEVDKLYGELIGSSQNMLDVKKLIEKASNIESTVLITGETGTGKGLAAKLVHELSDRKNEPFISVNISAIDKELFSSELFGHEKGSFTGAHIHKKGLFELAGKGIIFLDEIGDLEPGIQVKLLNIIDDKKTKRVGGTKDINIPARIIAATNQNLIDLVERNVFRSDLYFRLNVFNISMPPLRECEPDISVIAEYFISKFSQKPVDITNDALKSLNNCKWPGNVRELKNVIEMALLQTKNNKIDSDNIQKFLLESVISTKSVNPEYYNFSFYEAREMFVKDYLLYFLKKNNFNITKTSEDIGIQRTYIYKFIKQLKININE